MFLVLFFSGQPIGNTNTTKPTHTINWIIKIGRNTSGWNSSAIKHQIFIDFNTTKQRTTSSYAFSDKISGLFRHGHGKYISWSTHSRSRIYVVVHLIYITDIFVLHFSFRRFVRQNYAQLITTMSLIIMQLIIVVRNRNPRKIWTPRMEWVWIVIHWNECSNRCLVLRVPLLRRKWLDADIIITIIITIIIILVWALADQWEIITGDIQSLKLGIPIISLQWRRIPDFLDPGMFKG